MALSAEIVISFSLPVSTDSSHRRAEPASKVVVVLVGVVGVGGVKERDAGVNGVVVVVVVLAA